MEPQNNPLGNESNGLAVRILSVIGGLLAAICFLIFLALTDITRSNAALSITAIGFIVLAIVGNRTIDHLFFDTSITALYVAGCIALCYTMMNSHWNIPIACLVFMLIAISTFLLSRGGFFPFLAVLLFNTALTWLIMESVQKIEISQFVVLLMGVAFFWLNFSEAKIITLHEARFIALRKIKLTTLCPAMKRLFRPLHTGFFVSFACGLVWISGVGFAFDKSIGVLSIFVWMGMVVMLRQAMTAMAVRNVVTRTLVYLVCLVLLMPTLFAPALSGALLLLLICFCYGYKTEMGISLLVFAYTIVKYYYDLQLTLLAKSITLFLTGVTLLAVWYFFTKHTRHHEEI